MATKKRKKRMNAGLVPVQMVPITLDATNGDVSDRLNVPLVKTCIMFVILMAAMHAIAWRYSLTGKILWGNSTVKIVSYLLDVVGVNNIATDNTITMPHDKWLVLPECTGLNAAILFSSFVFAYASSFKAKLMAILVGIPLLIIANVTRLVALGWVTEHYPTYAHVFHDYVWETLFLFLIVAMWGTWVRQVVNCER